MRRPNPWPPVLHRLITNAKLPQIKSHHLGLDLHLVELLPRIDPNDAANHLGHHNHVPEVRLHEVGFLVGFRLLFGFAEFLDEAHGFALEATVEAAAGAGVDYVAELVGGEVQESVGCEFGFWDNVFGGGRRTGRGRCHGRRICGRFSSS